MREALVGAGRYRKQLCEGARGAGARREAESWESCDLPGGVRVRCDRLIGSR